MSRRCEPAVRAPRRPASADITSDRTRITAAGLVQPHAGCSHRRPASHLRVGRPEQDQDQDQRQRRVGDEGRAPWLCSTGAQPARRDRGSDWHRHTRRLQRAAARGCGVASGPILAGQPSSQVVLIDGETMNDDIDAALFLELHLQFSTTFNYQYPAPVYSSVH